MKTIDFSSKHDILLMDEQGKLQPMDEPYFAKELVAPDTWKIRTDGDHSYLVIGSREALVIDSGYGCGDLRAYCQSISPVPVRNIANTHHHFDHTANNCYFDCAYMAPESEKLATIPYPSFAGMEFPRDYPKCLISDGYQFDLGDRVLETFQVPDHAPGSLCFLDRKNRLLFSGDEFMLHRKSLSGTVEHWKKSLDKLAAVRGEFDTLLAGGGVYPASLFDEQYEAACRILEGEEGQPLRPMGGSGSMGGFDSKAGSGSTGGVDSRGGSVSMGEGSKPRGFAQEKTDGQGHLIYHRDHPHPGDGPKPSAGGGGSEFLRALKVGATTFVYDIRKVHDKES